MMYIYFYYIYCVLQSLANIYSVSARRKPLHRYLLEEGAKQPIFGSYSYDPIRQVFDINPEDHATHGINGSYVYSTAFPEHEGFTEAHENETEASSTTQRFFIFRKHVSETTKAALRKINNSVNVTSVKKIEATVIKKAIETNEIKQHTKSNKTVGVSMNHL